MSGNSVEGDYPAALYAALHDGNPGDVEFYRAACAGARTVLELGSGSGRVGLALAAAGFDVVGVEISPSAAAAASRAGLVSVCADMTRFALRRRFHRVIIPYNTLYCLLSDDQVVACLDCARRHLAPGGQIVFDGYVAALGDFDLEGPYETEPEEIAAIDADGRHWTVYERSRLWPARCRIDASYEHVPDDGGAPVSATIRQRWLTVETLPQLLARARLVMVALEGGFRGEPYTPLSEHFVVRAERWPRPRRSQSP